MIIRALTFILSGATIAAVISTLLLQNYARISCHWKWSNHDSFVRMVVMADPQMEGDAKIARLGKRAHIDLAFNDAYMHHVYRSMMSPSWSPLYSLWNLVSPNIHEHQHDSNSSSWTQPPITPTHVTILGDLFSSQWIDNTEFDVRLKRYQSIFTEPLSTMTSSFPYIQIAEKDTPELINVTGNHDIGYGYDISQERIERWEQSFGKSNFVTTTRIPLGGAEERILHFVVLNTMLIDGPSADENLRGQTWEFLQEASRIKERHPKDKIVLLTHIPFHKEKGVCVDPPDIRVHWDNTIIEQTMLTPNTTAWILNNLQPDFVLNGHDHEGCDTLHVATTASDDSDMSWTAYSTSKFPQTSNHISEPIHKTVREITQRSMMAEFGGYSGLFEVRVDKSVSGGQELEFSYESCAFYRDLPVWAVIVTDLIVAGAWSCVGAVWATMHVWSVARRGATPSIKEKTL
ncbi:MAG: hypothetical protein BYD32DRAFT_208943 [Podila humilis]|nr:MAG: hypothetical protein BYD32DRAFT_208943 [Podila humilis]